MTKVEHVEVAVPVVQPLPADLVADCEPHFTYSDASMTIESMTDRLEAVEIALAFCRNQLELIRAGQPTRIQ